MNPCTVSEVVDSDYAWQSLDLPAREDAFSFYDAQWLQAWSQAFLPDRGWERPLTIYSVASGGSQLGFLALARQKVSRLRVSALAGYYWPFRTLAVRNDDSARKAFAAAIAGHFSRRPPAAVLRFGPVSTADAALGELLSALVERGWKALRCESGGVFELKLPEEPAGLQTQMSGSLLKNINYLQRRMTKQCGDVSFERQVLGSEASDLLNVLSDIETASWVAKEGGEAKFMGRANRAYWTALGQAEGRCSDVIVWILRCGGAPIAFSAHIETKDTVYIIANSYDEQWKSYSPGSILAFELFADACRRGKRRVDWGQGDSGYKSRWGATCGTHLFDIMLFRPGLQGRLLFTLAQRVLPDWDRPDHV